MSKRLTAIYQSAIIELQKQKNFVCHTMESPPPAREKRGQSLQKMDGDHNSQRRKTKCNINTECGCVGFQSDVSRKTACKDGKTIGPGNIMI